MRVLLDTHVMLWWYLGSPELPASYKAEIERVRSKGEPAALSAISLWELAKLAQLGRIVLKSSIDELLERIERDIGFEVIPLTGRIAAESTRLGPTFHRDPADQLIAATARCFGMRLLTCDDRIRQSGVVAVL